MRCQLVKCYTMSAKHIEQYTNPSFEQESDQPPDPLGGVADVGAGNASSSSNGHIANDAGTANRKGHR